jgi:hypothetical protein
MISSWFVILSIAVALYQIIRFHKESERIQSIVHRLIDISNKVGLKNYSIRKLKYSRIISNSHAVMRDIHKGLFALERKFSYSTPYRLRRFMFVSNSDVLGNIESRLDKLEELIDQHGKV